MKTIWLCGEDNEMLTTISEYVGEELVNRNQLVELIIHNEIQEIVGKGLKDTQEDKSIFIDRLGFLGHLLHRNEIFTLIVSKDASIEDRRKVKDSYKNYIQINISNQKDLLCDLDLSPKENLKENAKKIIEYLTLEKIIPDQSHTIYSKEEEEEIRKRLEDLGYV